jgi:hypothetical protein
LILDDAFISPPVAGQCFLDLPVHRTSLPTIMLRNSRNIQLRRATLFSSLLPFLLPEFAASPAVCPSFTNRQSQQKPTAQAGQQRRRHPGDT